MENNQNSSPEQRPLTRLDKLALGLIFIALGLGGIGTVLYIADAIQHGPSW